MKNRNLLRALLLLGPVAICCLDGGTPVVATPARVELASSNRHGGALAADDFLPPSLDRGGRYLLFRSQADGIVAGDEDGDWDLFRKDLASGKVEWISVGAGGAASNGDISGDGRFVTFYADRTYVRDVRRGVTTVVDERPPRPVDAPAVSDDGATVAFIESTTLHVAHPAGGATVDVDVGTGAFLDLAPDGRWVVFVERDETVARLVRLDLATGARRTIYESVSAAGTGPVFPFVNADASVVSFTFLDGFVRAQAFVWQSGSVAALSAAPSSAAGQLTDDGGRLVVVEITAVDSHVGSVVVLNRGDGTTSPVGSTNAAWAVSLSRDGGTAAWTTSAALAADDDNGAPDVYFVGVRPSH
ncbi:MAG TPA: hypothetical protein VHM89_03480 [Acidimicrobiales bacterium]|nr:hypothetical protein [Acidimicrobiales bacterium]